MKLNNKNYISVLFSEIFKAFCLISDISMLERLMNTDVYKRDEKTRKFNHNYVTQLTKNYRSHESLLKVSNELFYENTLEACADNCKCFFFLLFLNSLRITNLYFFKPLLIGS